MMKGIATLIHGCVFLLLISAVATAGEGPLRVISQGRSGVVLEVTASAPRLQTTTREGGEYSELRIDGFESRAPEGSPELPWIVAHVWVPRGQDVVLDSARSTAPMALPLSHDIAFADRRPVHDGVLHRIARDERAYSRVYGTETVTLEDVSFAGSERIATVRFQPVRYDAERRRLRWTPSIVARLRFVPDPRRAVAAVGGPESGVARYIVVNADTMPAPARGGRRVDLVIAHESHRDAVQRLVQFKRMSGREVREYYVPKKTTEEIKSIIKTEYATANPPAHTLLVGNIDQIPAWKGNGDNSRTDYPYTTLDADAAPDVALGRIPAHNAEELGVFIDKVIGREIDPRNVGEVLITAGRDTSLGCPANVTKVGENFKAAGDDVNVTRKFKTEVSTSDVIDAYNENPNLIVYDGHGDQQGMQEIPLLIATLDKLTNRVFPIVLDIACLNAHWTSGASPRNFAEMILLRPSAGVAGIMASGGSGYGHDFFRTIAEIMATARKQLASDTKMNEIGQVILAAKIKHGPEDRAYWNYYGDPASSVWETTMGRHPLP